MTNESIAKYARTVLNSIEKYPVMHGDSLAIEMQYLLALEFLAISMGIDKKNVRDEYENLRKSAPGPSNLALSDREGATVGKVVQQMMTLRYAADPSLWVDLTGI